MGCIKLSQRGLFLYAECGSLKTQNDFAQTKKLNSIKIILVIGFKCLYRIKKEKTMKLKFIYLLLLLFSFTQNAVPQTGWLRQNPPQTGNITSICFLDQNTGFVCQSANLYKTTNSGINWSVLTGSKLKVQFLNINTGYSLDAFTNHLYKTTNGGSNWFLLDASYYTSDFYFINPDTGWSCYSYSICRTSNGGNNWDCIVASELACKR